MAVRHAAGHAAQPRHNIAISLSGDDADELRGYWEKLSDGGTVTVPLEKQMWGDEFGMCIDKFGIAWMVNIAAAGDAHPAPARSPAVGGVMRPATGGGCSGGRAGRQTASRSSSCTAARTPHTPRTPVTRRPGVPAVPLIAVNRPGYGTSDAYASTQLSVADDVVAVADQLGIDSFAVLGMSIGGAYALACAARHPDRVTAAGVAASPGERPRAGPADPPG